MEIVVRPGKRKMMNAREQFLEKTKAASVQKWSTHSELSNVSLAMIR